jgi:hypothetical protein
VTGKQTGRNRDTADRDTGGTQTYMDRNGHGHGQGYRYGHGQLKQTTYKKFNKFYKIEF